MSDIDWNFVTKNMFWSLFVIFLLLIAFAICVTFFYINSLTDYLNSIRDREFYRQRDEMVLQRRKEHARSLRPPDITVHIDTTKNRDRSPVSSKHIQLSTDSTVPMKGSKDNSDKTETKVTKPKTTVHSTTNSNTNSSQAKTNPSVV